jgi:hypothetical protein
LWLLASAASRGLKPAQDPSKGPGLDWARAHPGLAGPTTALQVIGAPDQPKRPARAYRFAVRGQRVDKAHGQVVHLDLQASQAGPISARVLDSQGRQIRLLVDLADPHGSLLITWDGTLADGKEAPGGSYTITVRSPDKTESVAVRVLR